MKKIFITILLTAVIFSCKKSNDNRTCWDCEVRRMDGSTYKDRTCTDGRAPQYTDNNGNDLNSFCTRR